MEKPFDLYRDNVDHNLYPTPIDNVTAYGKGLEPKIDNTTDAGKGILYKTCDGKEVATMEEVMEYNQMYYDSMFPKKEDEYSEIRGMHR